MHPRPDQPSSAPPAAPSPSHDRPGDVAADAAAPSTASRSFFTPRQIPTVHECELCGTVMYDHSCKIVCPNCGYKRDCSDP
jgi:ribosomal protein L37E